MGNGEYIFYADESGDHSLVSIDPMFPVFVLSICGFRIRDYCQKVVPRFQRLKFKYFGHDMVIMHEHEMRKQIGDFSPLTDIALRERFMRELSEAIESASFKIYSVIIDKYAFKAEFFPDNPYVVALRCCLEEIYRALRAKHALDKNYFFVFERRGLKEDRDLELEFHRIVDGQNIFRIPFSGFNIRFADKRSNSTGMQLADLTARPIGLHHIRPTQNNRSFDIIRAKLYRCRNVKRFQRGVISPSSR